MGVHIFFRDDYNQLSTKSVVAQLPPPTLFHRADEGHEALAFRRDVFEDDAVLYAHALADEVVHRQRGEHPILHRVLMQHLLVADVITVAVSPIAVNVNAEDVLDGILVAVEGGSAQRHSLAHLGALPPLVDFGQSNPFGPIDGVHQPDVLLEEGWDGLGLFFSASQHRRRCNVKGMTKQTGNL